MIRSFSKTDVGKKRKTNQDCVYTREKPIGNLPNLYAVADGMGGHRAGDYASRYTIENFAAAVAREKETDPIQIMLNAVKESNRKLVEAAASDKDLNGMGTTLVACTVKGNVLYCVSIGDSRMYICNHALKQITRDHSLVQEMVRIGELRPDEAKRHPDRNIITRAIGITEDAEADSFDIRLNQDDVILMCTDGLTNMVEDDLIFETIHSSRDIVEMVEELVNTANLNGGRDNIGVVMIQIKNDEETGTC